MPRKRLATEQIFHKLREAIVLSVLGILMIGCPGTEPTDVTDPQPEPEQQQEIDSDGDGLPDAEEEARGTSPRERDTDGDGLSDGEEVRMYGTNPLAEDTDGDGLPDGTEVFYASYTAYITPVQPNVVGYIDRRFTLDFVAITGLPDSPSGVAGVYDALPSDEGGFTLVSEGDPAVYANEYLTLVLPEDAAPVSTIYDGDLQQVAIITEIYDSEGGKRVCFTDADHDSSLLVDHWWSILSWTPGDEIVLISPSPYYQVTGVLNTRTNTVVNAHSRERCH
jgi:hypothetical protein